MSKSMHQYVIELLERYPDTCRKIALLRYELEHPAWVTPDEMLEAMALTREDVGGGLSGHVSDRTLYIATNYQASAERMNYAAEQEVVGRLIPLEREADRLEHYVSLLEPEQRALIRRCYFDRQSLSLISQEAGVTVKTLRKRRNSAIEAIVEMFLFAKGDR